MTDCKERIKLFVLINCILAIGVFLWSYEHVASAYNTTLLAFSYRYGFVSRGLLGTIYALLDAVLPMDMLSYLWALRFFQGLTVLSYLFFLWFFWRILSNTPEDHVNLCECVIAVWSLFLFSMFATENNLGRIDLILVVISVLCVLLIVSERALFMILPLTALAVMFHQGYVFMFFNVTLVFLFYRWMSALEKTHAKKGRRSPSAYESGNAKQTKTVIVYRLPDDSARRYGMLFFAAFLIGSLLFLYFEFFSRSAGGAIVSEIVDRARRLSLNGDYHVTLVDHEILGINLDASERVFRIENHLQLPLFLIGFAPYIIMTARLFSGMLKRCGSWFARLRTLALAAGVLTLVPNFLLKCDYGRWVFAAVTYYALVFLALFALRDPLFEAEAQKLSARLKQRLPWSILLLVYPVLFIPLRAVYISDWMKTLIDWVNGVWLHLY